MSASITLLKCIAKTLVKCTGNAVGGFAGDLIVELADGIWGIWGEGKKEAERKAELEAIAKATAAEMAAQISEVIREVVSPNQTEARQTVETYLLHVPAMVRQYLRRPSDPTGTTVPSDLVIRKAEDLLPFLPSKLPRFKPGDHALSGVDWQLEQLLGVGGFGEVWKATNPHLSSVEPVALKFCLDAAAAKVLRNEAAVLDRVMRQGKHAGIVQLLRTYLSAEIPCLEYEYVEGGDFTTVPLKVE